MAKKLVWDFVLNDRLSGPAGAETRALGRMKVVLEGAAEAAEKTAQKQERLARKSEESGVAFEGFTSKLDHGLGVMEKLGHGALRVAEGIGHLGLSFGEAALEAASFKESTLVSLSTVLGSTKDAQDVFKSTVSLAARLPITTQEAVEGATQLALAGIRKEDLGHLTLAASDVGSLNPGRQSEAIRLFLRQITDIQSVGLNARHLLALSQETHIPEDKIIANLARLSGQKVPESMHGTHLQKFLEPFTKDKDTAITAIAQTIADIQGGGKLGEISQKKGLTYEGLVSTIESRKTELLMDLDTSPAYARYRSFLGNAATLLDPNSQFGSRVKSRLEATFSGTFDRLFGDLAGDEGLGRLEQVFETIAKGGDLLGVGLESAAGFAKGFVNELVDADVLGASLFGPDGKLDPKQVKKVTEGFTELGHEVAKVAGGLVDVAHGFGKIIDFVSNDGDWGRSLADYRMWQTGIDAPAYDPTKVSQQNSNYAVTALALRDPFLHAIESGSSSAMAIDALTRPGGGPLGPVSNHMEVHVDARGAAPGVGQEVGQAVERVGNDVMKRSARSARMTRAK